MKLFSVLLILVFSLTTNILSQVQFTPHIITTSAIGAKSVYAIDIDGDGDMDVLSAARTNDKIVWYENDGNENFTLHTITTDADGARTVYAVDVDDDGDMDVLSASEFDDRIVWYENDGNENFTPYTITTDAIGARSVYAIDLDGDEDMDVLSASFADDKIAWYENLGVLGVNESTLLDFSVYPLPTTGILNIQSNATITQIELYSLLGQLVLSNSNKNTIDISSVSQGVYFIKIKDENGNIGTQKVMKK